VSTVREYESIGSSEIRRKGHHCAEFRCACHGALLAASFFQWR
jgi:hypothetical protein